MSIHSDFGVVYYCAFVEVISNEFLIGVGLSPEITDLIGFCCDVYSFVKCF